MCHGANDPLIPPEQVAAFEAQMRDTRSDWQLCSYGGAVHSFTNPEADKLGNPAPRLQCGGGPALVGRDARAVRGGARRSLTPVAPCANAIVSRRAEGAALAAGRVVR